MPRAWTVPQLLELARAFQPVCVLAAAADLEIFDALASKPAPQSAPQLASALSLNLRGLTILLDALAALELLDKSPAGYALPPTLVPILTSSGSQSVLAMVQHQANCLRRWSQLAHAVKIGRPLPPTPSVRGHEADHASFIQAMDGLSRDHAPRLVAEFGDLKFSCLLDIGGGSGTWTLAFLRAFPQTQAILFDLPSVIPMARRRLSSAGLLDRVRLVPGDFYTDPLPPGSDLALLSAIIHQNSQAQNRALFASVASALAPGGRLLIRDVVMDESRTSPVGGALFAVNMLSATPAGGTFTLTELQDDLHSAGFSDIRQLRTDPWMNSLVLARKSG
ncbi:MAG: methyltransferase domain-containing protein [Phycisphaeraceae bacterium]|nr:methyltransferase domain-containing protein [Phycisphaeraceae bacterium]